VVETHACRFCSGTSGELVLDLGNQPACDHFPAGGDPKADPTYSLRMWLCSACCLAQLVGDPIVVEQPLGAEPRALVSQATDAIECLAQSGWLSGRGLVVEFPSPHGGSWLDLLAARDLVPAGDDQPGDLVVDSFGMMHEADQSAALAIRTARVGPGGVLLLQYHALDTIVRLGQWNALRHGHFAYYSTSALIGMLEANGFHARMAWSFDLYGGTVLLAATREPDPRASLDESLVSLLSRDIKWSVRDPVGIGILQDQVETHTQGLREWLVAQRATGRDVLGYGAASRAVALLCRARVDRHLLPAIVDSSPSKQGRRMPGTDVPIVGPEILTTEPPTSALLLIPDLLDEVRAEYPAVEAAGGAWVDAEALRVESNAAITTR
jgi:C-methyltransferase C-terminal domain/Putative zinc binding domain